MASSKFRSVIWQYFKISVNDESKAICNDCQAAISRGKAALVFSTKPLINHLQAHHPLSFRAYQDKTRERDEQQTAKTTQSSLRCAIPAGASPIAEALQRQKPWPAEHKTAALLTRRITEMIAVDMQPISVVEDTGFRRLMKAAVPQYCIPSRKYFAETQLNDLYSRVRCAVQSLVDEQPYVSFTVDSWTSSANQSYMGLTAHWLTETFTRRMAVLHCEPVYGSHTSVNIADIWRQMTDGWKISTDRTHLVVSDSAANMKKAFADMRLTRIACFSHTIQLAVRDGLLSQRAVTDACAVARGLVGHFKHSPLACDRLKEIQREIGLPQHMLIQDVATRWSSTFLMLERLLEQRRAVTVYATESDARISVPSAHQWQLLEKATLLLQQFAELTSKSCCSDTTMAYVIPAVSALKYFLRTSAVPTPGVGTMRDELLSALTDRFSVIDDNMLYVIATALDPRYKLKYFSRAISDRCRAEVEKLCRPTPTETETEEPQPSTSSASDSISNPNKKPKIDGFWDCFDLAAGSLTGEGDAAADGDSDDGDEMDNSQGASSSNSQPLSQSQSTSAPPIVIEMDTYFNERPQDRDCDVPDWWRTNQWRFPLLSAVARRYLGAPPSSVASERLFSTAGDICTDARNRLLPERAEQLIFLKVNLPLIDFNYD